MNTEDAPATVMQLSQYQLVTLHRDGEFILYRGLCPVEAEMRPRSILVLSPVMEHPAPATVKKLEHEFSLKDELDSAWALRPLALTQHQNRTTLLFEDPNGAPLDRLLRQPTEVKQVLRCGIALATALGQAHRRGLVHKDIKPSNVLANAALDQVWLMGFGIASRLPRERQRAEPPEFISGTLAYMAPEQTGRMNRSIDSRSDLYALGITLYELLTGSLPFAASDPMEWVHCHVARQPLPPAERRRDVPCSVSAIIMKLLAKTPEERYQTASGVERDLRRCLEVWNRERSVYDFALGEHDMPDRLQIPEKLYGREREIETLLASFDRVVNGGVRELVLVSGYSGIGKSSVVNQLQPVLVPSRGLFASGKFDQYKRDIPYSTLAQAFQSLIRPLLGKSEADLAPWRDALQVALGPSAGLIVDLIPEVKLIIGEPPPVPEIPPQDAQRRFQLVFRRFIGVFARPDHPLALFLDDLQWLDAATLDLLEDLLTPAGVQHLMLIGAYRDSEVTLVHPLMRKLEAIRNAGANVEEIVLAPLAREHLGQLIADALRCEPERGTPLAKLVHEKTAGNPFFAILFLSSLAEEKMLTFDHDAARWSYDLDRIHAKGYTDNVVDLMVEKVSRLPVDTQAALKQLACLGSIAKITTLSLVFETSEEQVHADLWEAVHLELIERLDGSYKFLHDRVQEAAYSLISEVQRAEVHLRIGRLLAAHTPLEKREEAIFEIINQLNRATALISARTDKEQLAEFNLIAGKRAKASTAYVSALTYLIAGTSLMSDDGWTHRPDLMFALELCRAECEFLTGELSSAETRLTMLSLRAASPLEQGAVACLRIELYTTLDQNDRAVDVSLAYLHQLGINMSPHPTEEEARREYEHVGSLLGQREIEELIDLPLTSESQYEAIVEVLTRVLTPALYTDVHLASLLTCRIVNLSLEHGITDASSFAFVCLGIFAGPRFGDYKTGFRLGRLGYDLAERHGFVRFRARAASSFAGLIIPWNRHLRTATELTRRAFDAAHTVGDLRWAAYTCSDLVVNLFAIGDPLPDVQREAERGLEFARTAAFGVAADIIMPVLALVRTLCGLTTTFGCFDQSRFDELSFERHVTSDASVPLVACWYWIRKMQARFFAGDYESAVEASLNAQRLLWTSPSFFQTAEAHFYGALSHAALCDETFPDQYRQHVDALIAHHKQLVEWAENCPENFENRAMLVGAEIARIEGRELEAERLYETAIQSARQNEFVQNEALAYERASTFYRTRGFDQFADAYLRNARTCYASWGADGKVNQLDGLHAGLKREQPLPGPTSTITAPVEGLDLATVIGVSQAISGEIVLEKLLDIVMRKAMEHAGADRGLLIFQHGHQMEVKAEATVDGDRVAVRMLEEPISSAAVPESILRYVTRTREQVIVEDAAVPNSFSTDDHLREKSIRSVACLPLLKQGELIALLYLENKLAANVFTPARLKILAVLASQAAISLENSRLYHEIQRAEEERRVAEQALDKARSELAHSARVMSLGALTASIAHEINQPIAAITTSAGACLRWLNREQPEVQRAREAAVRIEEDGRRAAEIITHLKAFYKKDVSTQRERVSVNDLVGEMLALLRSEAERHSVLMRPELAADQSYVNADRVLLQQVLMNLMLNGMEAMSEQGGELKISTRHEGEEVIMSVSDTGVGIPADKMEEIFNAFVTTKTGGTGMGLAISRTIIESHGGRLWATSNAEGGATFHFSLQAQREAQSEH